MADGKITATLKAGRDFDAPWIVIGAETAEELTALINAAGDAGLGAAVANAARGLQATYSVGSAMGPVTQVSSTPTAPVQEAAPVAPVAPAQSVPPANGKTVCPHGQRTVYNGSKNGRPYTAYFCTLPKGHPDQCAPEWG